jgi:uncharacterized protein (TIGR02996 family)
MQTDTAEIALRSVIAQHRDDAGPRLALADHLDSTGRGEWAMFIRAQLTAGGSRTVGVIDGKTAPFEEPDGSPIAADVRALAALGVTVAVYTGGFAQRIGLPWAAWLEHADALRNQWPLREVWLTTWPAFFDRVADEWVERDSRYYWLTQQECLAAVHCRWPGITFGLPKTSPPDPSTMIEIAVKGADKERIEEVKKHRGKVNSKVFFDCPPRSLLFRDVLVDAAEVGNEATIFGLLPARPDKRWGDELEECDFAVVFDRCAAE